MALFTIGTLVHIINPMAAVAASWRAVVTVASVAVDTGNRGVLADQAITNSVVIEPGVRPGFRIVATLTVLTKRAVMQVLICVTCATT